MVSVTEMRLSDYDEVIALWKSGLGITVDDSDSPEGIQRYLDRNPSSSFVAREHRTLLGAVLGGHDGRRGYLHHLAVIESRRKSGIGRLLADHVLDALSRQGIRRCHLFVRAGNGNAQEFWKHIGWKHRVDIVMMSHPIP